MIKTWKERVAPNINGQYLVGVKYAMQSEIDELRAALATARAEERERCIEAVDDAGGDNSQYHIAAIRALKDEPKGRNDE